MYFEVELRGNFTSPWAKDEVKFFWWKFLFELFAKSRREHLFHFSSSLSLGKGKKSARAKIVNINKITNKFENTFYQNNDTINNDKSGNFINLNNDDLSAFKNFE